MNPLYASMELVDNRTENKLELPINKEEGYAFVRYREHDNHIDLHHIEVSGNLRGQGIASTLAEKVFAYIASKNMEYTIYCSFLKTWKNRRDAQEAEKKEEQH